MNGGYNNANISTTSMNSTPRTEYHNLEVLINGAESEVSKEG